MIQTYKETPEERALREAMTTLRYIAYGDFMEGIQPSDPAREAHLTIRKIETFCPEAVR